MSSAPTERRLAAIMFTDIVGYTALMAESEEKGLRVRERHRALVRPLVEQYHGESIEARGDESLSVFPTALDAVNCALAIEKQLQSDPELWLHVGIHLGDLVVQGGEVSGDGVNIASRICALSEGGGLCVSGEVYRSIRNQPGIEATALGERELKNVPEPVAVYAVSGTGAPPRAVSETELGFGRRLVPRRAWGITALLVIALGLGWWLYRPPADVAPLTSIAVLPFDDMSPAGDQKWLAHGMAEELIEMLSRIEQLRVIARTSSVAAAATGADVGTIGAMLNVGSIVEGSVRRSDNQIRVTAQLIRVEDGSHLWTARYDRKLDDVFAIQGEIGREVAEAIRTELGVGETKSWLVESRYSTPDVRAWELLKKADARGMTWTEDGLRDQVDLTRQALEIDPEYATAHALHGWGYWFLWSFGYDPRDENRLKARASAKRALGFDPTNGAAQNLLGWLSMGEGDWQGAETRYARALKATPSHGPLRQGYGVVLLATGRVEEAAPHLKRAVTLDPGNGSNRNSLGLLYLLRRDYEAAIDEVRRGLVAWPSAPVLLATAHHLNGDDDRASEVLIQSYAPSHEAASTWREVFDQDGLVGVGGAVLDYQISQSGRSCTSDPGRASLMLALIGEPDQMFECLDEGFWAKSPPSFIKVWPTFDPYRSDPRFIALLRRMGLEE